MSVPVEDSSESSDVLQSSEASKTDVLTKEASVTVGEKQQTSSPDEAEGDRSAGPQDEADTVYVNGHPVIENGMTTTVFIKQFLLSVTDSERIGDDVSKFLISDRDDGDPSFTFRSIVLGTAFTALSSVITMIYIFKPTTMQVSAVFLQRKLIASKYLVISHLTLSKCWSTSSAKRGQGSPHDLTDSNRDGCRKYFDSLTLGSHLESKNTLSRH
jgi:hypothetical protein